MRGVWLEDLTWPEVKSRLDAGAVVVVPIGAVAKEHGHHLPMSTDYRVARALGDRIAAELPVLIAPVISFGYYPAFVRYPGSQHLRSETFVALLTDILGKLVADGARRLAVINTGVSTEAPLRVVVRDLYERTGVRIHTADIRMLGRKTKGLMAQKLGGHGDESETSTLLAIAPELVRIERAVVDYGHALDEPQTVFYTPTVFVGDPASGPDYSVSGVRGDPTLATREKGEAVLADMAGELVEGLRRVFPDAW
ncbi:MAG: creatininase family protein [Alphaproteobacteria bacterium]|nr:creatininase family protein [Alphaproteobacteria bacterium]